MNQNERDNLNFILNISQDEFESWMEEASADDIDYAIELIRQARSELLLEEMELMEVTESANFTEAKNILDRIRQNVGKI